MKCFDLSIDYGRSMRNVVDFGLKLFMLFVLLWGLFHSVGTEDGYARTCWFSDDEYRVFVFDFGFFLGVSFP